MLNMEGVGPGESRSGAGAAVSPIIETEEIRLLTDRALTYLQSGFPVHLRGASGTGKTTLALHIAGLLGRPVVMVAGTSTFTADSLLGGATAHRTRRVVDRFITSVVKTETESVPVWVDEVLTSACRYGHTLVYDEFTRSPPEANNVLLNALEERVLTLPSASQDSNHLSVHPDFRIIFTSNPVDYAGVQDIQDALLDRMITIDLDFFDQDTEEQIVCGKTGIALSSARSIVNIVRDFRQSENCAQVPTMRASLMIAGIAATHGWAVSPADPHFLQLCLDVLLAKVRIQADTSLEAVRQRQRCRELLIRLAAHYCTTPSVRQAAPDLSVAPDPAPALAYGSAI